MTKRDLAWRLVGVLALAGAAGSSLLHRDVLTAHAHGPASSLRRELIRSQRILVPMDEVARIVLAVIASACAILYARFRQAKWL